ncbi:MULTISPECIES: WG repeat-containing protein [unclassified Alcaligenes]|uniref:WG repeat-containing protein n=1 Tax=unclassified Alcaligenes TaxID=259357 RepID=UPI003014590D
MKHTSARTEMPLCMAGAICTIVRRVQAGLRAEGLFWIQALFLLLTFTFGTSAYSQRLIQDEHGWVYVNHRGEALLRPFIYDNGPDYFEEGLARFVHDGKMGFHDEALRIWVPARYDFAFPFVNGKAQVGMDCHRVSDGEHRSVYCQHWDSIVHPVSGSTFAPDH